MIGIIFKISENEKYITQESTPLSGNINHFLNPAYFGNTGNFGIVVLFIIFFLIIIMIKKNKK